MIYRSLESKNLKLYYLEYPVMHYPYRSTYHSFDWDETFKCCCKHARGGFGN